MKSPSVDSNSYKRLVVFSDGTWQTSENETATNILKLALATSREDSAGTQQVAIYDSGIGTDGGNLNRIFGGALGLGIDKNIKELYTFLAMNYQRGDEIYLFGFSRGAYTVRSLAGMISNVGLVRRSHLPQVNNAYELYRKKTPTDGEEARQFREQYGETAPIKLLCCFDTVGSLGLPTGDLIGNLSRKRYEFHDTTLGANVMNAIHMMSIDEERESFKPTYMQENPNADPGQLTQLFFWGGHGGIGGGDDRQLPCSALTINFLVEEMKRRGLQLEFSDDFLPPLPDVATATFDIKETGLLGFLFTILGRNIRRIDAVAEIHASAIKRYQLRSDYRPTALKKLSEALLACNCRYPES